MDMKLERTMEHLRNNRMQAFYTEKKEQVVPLIKSLMNENETVACGGSMTLFETGVIDFLREGPYHFLDRYEKDITPERLDAIFHQSFSADTYITGANAITEEGELYNVDGRGNRVAAMIFGPKSVIVVAGINKIVKDMSEAVERLRRTAAPANATRLECKTPCVETGICQDCRSKERICSTYTIFRRQSVLDRIKVILAGVELGY